MHEHDVALDRGKREVRVLDEGEPSNLAPRIHTSAKKRAEKLANYDLGDEFDWQFVS